MTDYLSTPAILTEYTLLREGCPLHYWVGGQAGRPLIAFLHGEHDRAGTIRRDMPEWAKQEKHAVYQVIPDAAHNANQDNSEFTNRAILMFLQRRET